MPVIAIKFECDICHKTYKGTEPVSLLIDGHVTCQKCSSLIEPSRAYTWFSPTEAVISTKKAP